MEEVQNLSVEDLHRVLIVRSETAAARLGLGFVVGRAKLRQAAIKLLTCTAAASCQDPQLVKRRWGQCNGHTLSLPDQRVSWALQD